MFTIPDKGEGLSDIQSILFQEQLDILVAGIRGVDAVLSGCAVSPGTGMTLSVATGRVRSASVELAVSSGSPTVATADATNPRLDLVVVDSSGAIAVRPGTPAAAPKPPARSANDVALALVYVPASLSAVGSGHITDARVYDLTNVPHTFSKPQAAATLALTSASAWDGTDKQHLTVDVNGANFTVANPSATVDGVYYTLFVKYTTAHTITLSSAFKGVGDVVPSALAGKYDHFTFRSDGTNLMLVGAAYDIGA